MNIYNASHKNDLTAYLAIKNIEGKEPRKMTRPGLTYKIGEVVQLTWVCDMLVTQKEYEKYKDRIK